jgi:hypothetical protein
VKEPIRDSKVELQSIKFTENTATGQETFKPLFSSEHIFFLERREHDVTIMEFVSKLGIYDSVN